MHPSFKKKKNTIKKCIKKSELILKEEFDFRWNTLICFLSESSFKYNRWIDWNKQPQREAASKTKENENFWRDSDAQGKQLWTNNCNTVLNLFHFCWNWRFFLGSPEGLTFTPDKLMNIGRSKPANHVFETTMETFHRRVSWLNTELKYSRWHGGKWASEESQKLLHRSLCTLSFQYILPAHRNEYAGSAALDLKWQFGFLPFGFWCLGYLSIGLHAV